jgi:hypothetical protein
VQASSWSLLIVAESRSPRNTWVLARCGMETVINGIHRYSNAADYAALVKFLKEHSIILAQHTGQILITLETLDLQAHSLGYLFLLYAHRRLW